MNADIRYSSASKMVDPKTADIKPSIAAPKTLVPDDRIIVVSDKATRPWPFVIAFVYVKGENKPYMIKGNGRNVNAELDQRFNHVPYVVHRVCYRREIDMASILSGKPTKIRSYDVLIHLALEKRAPWIRLEKRHNRPDSTTLEYFDVRSPYDKAFGKHERWYLFMRDGESIRILAKFRKPPRGWIHQLNEFLEKE